MHKLIYLQVSSRILNSNSTNQASVEKHSEQSRKPSSQQGILKETKRCTVYVIAASWVTGRQFHLSVSCWLPFLTWMIWYRYLYNNNYKAVNTYHQVFCYPESVWTKQENLMVYCMKFMQPPKIFMQKLSSILDNSHAALILYYACMHICTI